MKDSQIFNQKDSQRTAQASNDPGSNTVSSNVSDVLSNGLYDYQIITAASGTKYQQFIRQEAIDGAGLAGGFAIDAVTGSLWTYGQNDQGQLGDGTVQSRSSPVSVLISNPVVSCQRDIAYNTFALDTFGNVWSVGSGLNGSLGNGSTSSISSPIIIGGGRQFSVLATGIMPSTTASSGGALDISGYAWTWGNNSLGQLGLGTTSSQSTPTSVIGGRQFVALNRNGRAIDLNNQPWSWSDNTYGQLGLGTTNAQSSPMSVVGISNIAKIASGGQHTLFLTQTGGLYGCGLNNYGQLGDGTTLSRSLPVAVSTLASSKIVDIAAGLNHSVALDQFGKLWSWGQNSYGQLGQGTTNFSVSSWNAVIGSPSLINTPQFMTASSSGELSGAIYGVLDINSYAWMWGYGRFGQLGLNTTNLQSSPVSVLGGRQWSNLGVSTTGDTVFGLDNNGFAWMWGGGGSLGGGVNYGVLGNNSIFIVSSPVSVVGGQRWKTLVGGGSGFNYLYSGFSTGLDLNGYAWHWGTMWNAGVGTRTSSPVSVAGNRQFIKLIGTDAQPMVIALDANSYAWSWGQNWGNLGNGLASTSQTYDTSSPVSVLGGIQWKDIKIGVQAGTPSNNGGISIVVGLDIKGYAWTWSAAKGISTDPSLSGILGNNTTASASSPVSVVGNRRFSKIIIQDANIIGALDLNGYAWTWGLGTYGLGNNNVTNQSSPVSVVGGLQFSDLKFANTMFVGLTTTSQVWSWGSLFNSSLNPPYLQYGLCGDGTTNAYSSPVSVVGLPSNVVAITGNYTPYVLTMYSGLWTWGNQYSTTINSINSNGVLGDGTTSPRSSPVSVKIAFNNVTPAVSPPLPSTIPNAKFVATGTMSNQTSGIDPDGNCWSWGQNFTPPLTSPVSVAFVAGGIRAPGSVQSSLVLDQNGYAWTWGDNTFGQLGLGTTQSQSLPTSMPTTLRWTQVWITSSGKTMVGIDTAFHTWCWGSNTYGQLGDGTTSNRSSPASVVGGRNFLMTSVGSMTSGIAYLSGAWAWGQITPTLSTSSPIGVGYITAPADTWTGLTNLPNNDGNNQGFAIAVGNTHSQIWTWGSNLGGELGNGTTTSSSSPVSVLGGRIAVNSYISAGIAGGKNFATIVEATTRNAWTWGGLLGYSLGDGTTNQRSSPVSVLGGVTFANTLQSSGTGNVMGIDYNSVCWTWGPNTYGQLGTNSVVSASSPVSVVYVNSFKNWINYGWSLDPASSAPTAFVSSVTSGSPVWSWGSNTSGNCGDGTTVHRSSPVSILGLTSGNVNQMLGAQDIYAVLGASSQLWSWGSGGIGDGTTISKSSPTSIFVGIQIPSPGGGQLGDGTSTNRSYPILISGSLHAKNKRGS